jgi:hypothetical protein
VVNLVGFQLVDQFDEMDGISQVPIVKEKLHPVNVRILIQMVDSVGIEGAGTPDDAVNLIAFLQQ